jgi:hypothetical protein
MSLGGCHAAESALIVGGVRGCVTFIDPSSRIFCVNSGGATCVFQFRAAPFPVRGLLGLA